MDIKKIQRTAIIGIISGIILSIVGLSIILLKANNYRSIELKLNTQQIEQYKNYKFSRRHRTQVVSTSEIQKYVEEQSIIYGINPELSACLVSHESQWNPSRRGLDTGNTISRGLWQINDFWHPEVSDAVAYNYKLSTIWSLKWIKSGHVSQWSTYSLYCAKLPVFIK